MQRPTSIVRFEQFYLGAVVLGLVNNAFNWTNLQEQMAAAPNSQLLPDWFLPATIGIGLIITLLLWYFVARRGAVVAKWIVVVFFVLGLIGLPGIVMGMSSGVLTPIQAIVALIGFALNAAAVFMLFRPDTKPWFGGASTDLTDTFS